MNYPFVNPPLPYSFDSLEPYIDTLTMHLHHDRHLQTYVDNLNNALKDYKEFHSWSLEQLLTLNEKLPAEIRTQVTNNGGGVYNHIFYFESLTPNKTIPHGFSASSIIQDFKGLDSFKKELKKYALYVFGSGYAWLVFDKNRRLQIVTTKNQYTPMNTEGFNKLTPLLNLDVWEHAYYLKHYNLRGDYIDNFMNIINWDKIEQRYTLTLGL